MDRPKLIHVLLYLLFLSGAAAFILTMVGRQNDAIEQCKSSGKVFTWPDCVERK